MTPNDVAKITTKIKQPMNCYALFTVHLEEELKCSDKSHGHKWETLYKQCLQFYVCCDAWCGVKFDDLTVLIWQPTNIIVCRPHPLSGSKTMTLSLSQLEPPCQNWVISCWIYSKKKSRLHFVRKRSNTACQCMSNKYKKMELGKKGILGPACWRRFSSQFFYWLSEQTGLPN